MPPLKQRLNTTTPGGRNGSGAGLLYGQKKRPGQNSILGAASKNKSVLFGKIVKRRSYQLRKNNIALAKALNSAKQQNSELTALVMEYRERAHAAERQLQQLQELKADLQALISRYADEEQSIQDGSDESSQDPVLQISLPVRNGAESCSKNVQYQNGFKEARTQLVNPMVQGMSINKVKVRLERINDVPHARRSQAQEPATSPAIPDTQSRPASGQHSNVQDTMLNSSPDLPTVRPLQGQSNSPVDEDITMNLSLVPELRNATEPFIDSVRVPSLTLQRLSTQEIRRTTSAAYMTEHVNEASPADSSSQNQSGSAQLGQSMFPVVENHISPRQSAHGSVEREHVTTQNSDSPDKRKPLLQSSLENPLEGTSWMYDTSRISRRIRVRGHRSLHQKSPKREPVKRRYTVKNLAAKDNYDHSHLKDVSPPVNDETALQDMSLTLCLPVPSIDRRVLSEREKPSQTESHGNAVDVNVRVSRGNYSNNHVASLAGKSPTVSVTRLFEADIFRLSTAGNDSSSSDVSWASVQATVSRRNNVPVVVLDASVGRISGTGDSNSSSRAATVDSNSSEHTVNATGAASDTPQETAKPRKSISDAVKVVLTRVDNEKDVLKPVETRSKMQTRQMKVVPASQLVRLPSRRAKKVVAGTYKEPSLSSKLRR